MEKTLSEKLARIARDPACRDFILADAKDADMALGLAAAGENHTDSQHAYRSLAEYRESIREIVDQGLIDICLMSASTSHILVHQERLFEDSAVTPAVRANDTTDIWLAGREVNYTAQPSLPFRTPTLDEVMHGTNEPLVKASSPCVNLCLYSITLNNDAARDRTTLAAYREFRHECQTKGVAHFLEVFAPNAAAEFSPPEVAQFVCNSIVRLLAGIPQPGRPMFLKIPCFGGSAIESLLHYDASLIVGVLGGSSGTTHDAFRLAAEAKRHGARAAIFGRKINHSEHPLSFVRLLRTVCDDELDAAEAVRAYHGALAELRITPDRPLEEDLQTTVPQA